MSESLTMVVFDIANYVANCRKLNETVVLESAINVEKDKQDVHIAHMKKRAELLMSMRRVELLVAQRNN